MNLPHFILSIQNNFVPLHYNKNRRLDYDVQQQIQFRRNYSL